MRTASCGPHHVDRHALRSRQHRLLKTSIAMGSNSPELKFVDPHALKDNPDKARRKKSSPRADALLLATIKAVGIVQPPVVATEADGGDGFVIDDGRRRAPRRSAEPPLVVDQFKSGWRGVAPSP